VSIKLRFSLRCLLVLAACVAALCYWHERPRRIAEQFVEAIRAGDYKLAEAMFVAGSDYNPLSNKPAAAKEWKATTVEQTTKDWLAGRCFVLISTNIHDYTLSCRVEVTRMGPQPATHWRMEKYPP
jgi:hypothetical protein